MEKKMTTLVLALAAVIVIGGVAASLGDRAQDGAADTVALLDPANGSYLIEGRAVTLVGGVAQDDRGRTTVFDASVRGDIDGDGLEDAAVVLAHDGGGSGTMYYLTALLYRTDGASAPVNAVFVGDRIAPQTTQIEDGVILFNYADRYPWEPIAARPSVGKTKRVAHARGILAQLPTPSFDTAAARTLALATWGDCSGDSIECREVVVNVLDGADGVWYVEAIYDGFADDSVRAERHVAAVHYADGWIVGEELIQDWRCQEGRGHQDFSSQLCI
jgi:hypothetical protein